MKIIDVHTHIYPEKIVEKATRSIGEFYDLKMSYQGSLNCLKESNKDVDVVKFIVFSVAMSADKVKRINDFIAREVAADDKLVGFMTLHPDMTESEVREEIDRCAELNLKGIKMHPDMQRFYIDEERAMKIYSAAGGRMPVLLHTGDNRYRYSEPDRLARMALTFPDTTFIGAHFGGYSKWNELDCYLDVPNVMFDTSSTLSFLESERASAIIKKLGADRFMFATDFPITAIADELKLFMKLDLTDKEREDILYNNARAFLNGLGIAI